MTERFSSSSANGSASSSRRSSRSSDGERGAASTVRSSPERSEQRAANRTRLEVEVTFDSESQFFSGITRDVSRGGMFVATYRTLPVGQSILLDFSLPSGERIATAGTVCWVREGGSEQEASPGMGIAFEALVQRDYALIEEFCTAREPLYIDLDAPNDDSE